MIVASPEAIWGLPDMLMVVFVLDSWLPINYASHDSFCLEISDRDYMNAAEGLQTEHRN